MSELISCREAAELLSGWDDILVVCHQNPDGDALGSMTGLVRLLKSLGKRSGWYCADKPGRSFGYLFEGLEGPENGWEPAHIVTVDVADSRLLGDAWEKYQGKIELAIDHHGTHVPFASCRWVEPESAAAAEMVWELAGELGISPDAAAAGCLYTGVATDTGCFRYRNVTPRTLRTAAGAIEAGADAGDINQRIFETCSRAQLEAQRIVLDGMEFFCGGRAAIIQLPQSIYAATGAVEGELDALSSLPRQVEGVLVGVTLKEKPNGLIKASLRTNPPADASAICGLFGGGGHRGAAGCSFEGLSMPEAKEKLKSACQRYLEEIGSGGI